MCHEGWNSDLSQLVLLLILPGRTSAYLLFFFVYEKDYKEEQHFNCVTAQLLTVLIEQSPLILCGGVFAGECESAACVINLFRSFFVTD